MKQPQLGQKILEWRKAKGLTQEELVELCQINVRTIQRIEAGEVTPRSYTLKAIMEALEVNSSEFDIKSSDQHDTTPTFIHPDRLLRISFFFGIVYFIFAFAEGILDFMIWESPTSSISSTLYTAIKLIILVTFIPFMFGYYKLGKERQNFLISVTSLLFIVGTILSVSKDLFLFFGDRKYFVELLMADAICFGAVYILFGIGMLNFQKSFGSIALVTGCLSIATGIAFMTIIFAIPGLFMLSIVEILLLAILFKASENRVPKPIDLNQQADFISQGV